LGLNSTDKIKVKMTRVVSINCPTISYTPDTHETLFGFNDICPWNFADDRLLLLRPQKKLDRLPNGTDVADICIWNPLNGEMTKVAETTAWNFQQGSRQNWLTNGEIIFNTICEGQERASVMTTDGVTLRILDRSVYALSPDRKTGLSSAFGRINVNTPGYGYCVEAPSIFSHVPDDDGIWNINITSGEARLLLTYSKIAEVAKLPTGYPHFISHLRFNSSGDHVLFGNSVMASDGLLYSNLMVMAKSGDELRTIATEKMSHSFWLTNIEVACWARTSTLIRKIRQTQITKNKLFIKLLVQLRRWRGAGRSKLTSEGMKKFSIQAPYFRSSMAPNAIQQDGHFCAHPTMNIFVGDTYPDKDQILHLFIYDHFRDIKINIASFPHEVSCPDNGHLRSDLHPRWNRKGDKIAVDISESGVRRVAIVDAQAALNFLDGQVNVRQK
jgi:hypothetical protein